jgi:uncharacterized protein YycO
MKMSIPSLKLFQKRSDDPYYIQDKFKKGVQSCDIFLTRGFDTLGGEICNITKGIVNHAGLVVKDCDIIEAQFSGITLDKFQKELDNQDGVLVFRNTSLTDDQKAQILSYAYLKVQEKEPYNYAGILHFVLPMLVQSDPKNEYCSQFVTDAMAKADVRVSGKPGADTAPQDILDYLYINEAFGMTGTGWQLQDNKFMNLDRVREFLKTKNELK